LFALTELGYLSVHSLIGDLMFAGHILDTVVNQTLTGTKFVGISAPVGTDT